MKDGKRPDPGVVHPVAGWEKLVYAKPVVKSPDIVGGDFTYIADSFLPLWRPYF